MPVEKEKAAAAKTKYHVLRQTGKRTGAESSAGATPTRNDAFELVEENVEANGDQHAIRLHLEKAAERGGGESGVFIAVPARSWRPTPVEVKTERRVILGGGA